MLFCSFSVDNPTTGKLGYIAWLVIIILVILFSKQVDTFIDITRPPDLDLQFSVLALMCLFGLFVCANFLTSSEARVFMSRLCNILKIKEIQKNPLFVEKWNYFGMKKPQ